MDYLRTYFESGIFAKIVGTEIVVPLALLILNIRRKKRCLTSVESLPTSTNVFMEAFSTGFVSACNYNGLTVANITRHKHDKLD